MTSSGSPTGHPPQPAAARQRRQLALAGARGQVAKGRDFARRALQDWGWDGTESAEDVLLVVSELVTNASLHAGGCLLLVLTRDEVLRIEVFDASTELPRRDPSPRRGVPGGHGLNIIDRLCDRWGSEVSGHGKAVWAEIEASRLAPGTAAGGR
ncbi:ATP-binding protein [Streptomyces racemochromogenes]|uniref:ATP-binding protein n=1 Tax=Streptomyces racemochromogenes TaxID=67353 RepID=A0ABW7PPS6_9ACTN